MDVALRLFDREDIPYLLQWTAGAGEKALAKWAGPVFTYPLTEGQLLRYLSGSVGRQLYCITADDQPVGIIELFEIDQRHRNARIGKILIGDRARRGAGIATAAIQRLLHTCFHEYHLHKVSLSVLSDNIEALSCYVRNGFIREGVKKDHRYLDGRWHDLIELSLFCADWRTDYEHRPLHELKTERLIVRSALTSDVPAVCDYYRRNRLLLEEFGPKREDDFYTLERQKELLLDGILRERSGECLRCWIVPKGRLDQMIGSISLSAIIRGNFRSCFIGYQLDTRELRQGYMKEALAAVITCAFGPLGLHRIEANIMPENRASRATAESLGFVCEGLARDYLNLQGTWTDHLHYVLRAEQWQHLPTVL